MRVVDILRDKGGASFTVSPYEKLRSVAKKLHNEGVGAMIVSSDGDCVEGVISERDIAISLAVYGKDFQLLPAIALMKEATIACSPEDSVAKVAKLMTEKHLRHLPVVDGWRLAGVISIGDVLKQRLEEVQLESRVLRDLTIAAR